MKRPRPYIPLAVRVEVAERMFRQMLEDSTIARANGVLYQQLLGTAAPLSQRLRLMLTAMFSFRPQQLDHDPALILRQFNERTGKYTPDANDPAYLIYREKDDHLQKTTGRKPGALKTVTTKGSDIGLKTKFARLERKKTKTHKRTIPSRPFPKQRKFK
jgi:hypothetical protein